jgi:hypothetical protein
LKTSRARLATILTSIVGLLTALALTVSAAPASAGPDGAAATSARLTPAQLLRADAAATGTATPVPITVKRAPAAEAGRAQLADGTWVMVAVNGTSVSFDQIVLAYTRFSNPFAEVIPRAPFASGQTVDWGVFDCDDVYLFAAGLYLNGQLVYSTGNLTRDDSDGDLCSDVLWFVDA